MKKQLRPYKLAAVLFILLSGISYRSQAQALNTLAGDGSPSYNGEGSPSYTKELNQPFGVAVDASGNVYVGDTYNNRVRMITPAGVISTVAGTGTLGFGSENIAATTCDLFYPYGIALDAAGNLYITDEGTASIRVVDHLTGNIHTIAGNNSVGYSGDGLLATDAQLNNPTALTFDAAGNMYIADYGNNVIRKVDAVTNLMSTIAGIGTPGYSGDGAAATLAQLWNPEGVAVDGNGKVYVADWGSSAVRVIDQATGIISTLTGVAVARPSGVFVDINNNLYIASQFSNTIMMVSNTGVASVVAGTGGSGFSGDGGPPTLAKLNNPTNVAVVNATGNIYIADMANNRVRAITFPPIGPITGNSSLCIATTSTLSNATPGGTWISTNTSVVTVGYTTGVVTGVSRGVASILYKGNGGTAATSVTVDPLPNVGVILGQNQVCPGTTVTFTNKVGGGTWSTSNNLISIISPVGIASALEPGTVSIYYTVTDACGTTAAVSYPFTVLPLADCPSAVASPGNKNTENSMQVWPNPNEGTFTVNLSAAIDEAVHITISDIVGSKIKEYSGITNKPQEIKLDVAPGIYFIGANTAHGSLGQKIVIGQ